jgi:hypothetical protein
MVIDVLGGFLASCHDRATRKAEPSSSFARKNVGLRLPRVAAGGRAAGHPREELNPKWMSFGLPKF